MRVIPHAVSADFDSETFESRPLEKRDIVRYYSFRADNEVMQMCAKFGSVLPLEFISEHHGRRDSEVLRKYRETRTLLD